MRRSQRRGLESTRQIFSKDGGRAVHFLEAAALELDATKRKKMLEDASTMLANATDGVQQVDEVAESFFSHPPSPIDTEEPQAQGIDVPMDGDKMDGPAPARAPSTGDDAAAEDKKIKDKLQPMTKHNSDRRSGKEVRGAADFLADAVLKNAILVPPVQKAISRLQALSKKSRREHVSRSLRAATTTLQQAIVAAGTKPNAAKEMEDAVAMQAMHMGEDPQRVLFFGKQWDQLKNSNIGTQMSKADYVQQNLNRTKN